MTMPLFKTTEEFTAFANKLHKARYGDPKPRLGLATRIYRWCRNHPLQVVNFAVAFVMGAIWPVPTLVFASAWIGWDLVKLFKNKK